MDFATKLISRMNYNLLMKASLIFCIERTCLGDKSALNIYDNKGGCHF